MASKSAGKVKTSSRCWFIRDRLHRLVQAAPKVIVDVHYSGALVATHLEFAFLMAILSCITQK
ncbi:hypothetical protein [Formosimonas limnophila]|uniref:hypothetical protein n=1 Tax=Formosimonas limnophila TaxID=1384487 RepID=UPI0016763C56|nr:hypothetical protein [Formosimonas limnophila]